MNLRSPALLFVALATPLLIVGSAQAATYTTQITGIDNATLFNINYIEIVWSTTVAESAPVGVADLSDLSFSFYNDSNALVYTDVAISGGTVQAIGGVARTLSDLSFNAVSGISIADFDNDFNQVQLGAASGTTYNLYGDTSDVINVADYLDGDLVEDATFTVTGQSTSVAAVPEPSAYAALAGLLGLGFSVTRRKR